MAGRNALHRVGEKQALIDCGLVSDSKTRARLGTSRLVSLDLPPALSERVMNALKADPRTIDLRALAPHFYNLSQRILELFEEEEMVDVLTNVLFPLIFPLVPRA